LAIAALCAIAYGCYLLYKLWAKNRYRREGVTSLKELRRAYDQDPESVDYLERYSQLLKRVALTHYSREQVASLTGEAWVAFLDRTGSTSEFGMGPGQVLIDGNYARETFFRIDELHKIGDLWIRNHRALESSI
jgi:Ca-activated chloride channel family protein